MHPKYMKLSDFEELKLEDLKFPKFAFDVSYKIECENEEDFDRKRAMIEFCTKYENESFELFYKWFKKKDREEG